MSVDFKTLDGLPVIILKGRIDFKNSGPVTDTMQKAAQEADRLAVDCTELEYVSSSGLRSILLLMKKMDKKGGKLVFFGINSNVMQVLEMTGIKDLMTICDVLEQAREELSA